MKRLSKSDLMSLEEYAERRSVYRSHVIAHKKNRQVSLGPNATLYFENRLTIQYQIQEILRIEKICEAKEIEEELRSYNPLVPSGTNWKATFMIEFEDKNERKLEMERMLGVEKKVWVKIGNNEKVYSIANEDLEGIRIKKISTIHFLRFELNRSMMKITQSDIGIQIGIDHPDYHYTVNELPEKIRQSLIDDLDT